MKLAGPRHTKDYPPHYLVQKWEAKPVLEALHRSSGVAHAESDKYHLYI
jgi:hypothetical protein